MEVFGGFAILFFLWLFLKWAWKSSGRAMGRTIATREERKRRLAIERGECEPAATEEIWEFFELLEDEISDERKKEIEKELEELSGGRYFERRKEIRDELRELRKIREKKLEKLENKIAIYAFIVTAVFVLFTIWYVNKCP